MCTAFRAAPGSLKALTSIFQMFDSANLWSEFLPHIYSRTLAWLVLFVCWIYNNEWKKIHVLSLHDDTVKANKARPQHDNTVTRRPCPGHAPLTCCQDASTGVRQACRKCLPVYLCGCYYRLCPPVKLLIVSRRVRKSVYSGKYLNTPRHFTLP